ncbi:hypothetical protein PLESTB_001355700 [Pleodorina starrii]|uniref:Uncharacterized protein n=1 Tax=Pleodorina starrii TaxID=330485 RepID=A0A9W6F6S1_9CHLO|nr:hypothetical protein PLESTM_001915500 [Pleodorina starrii]GLC58409.1 hypothetical protein PLESTB_001355700 [Pleodorina starrii]GLC76473.1 hypothetical protein PLESTF_001785100 [Pleodorina starrii]
MLRIGKKSRNFIKSLLRQLSNAFDGKSGEDDDEATDGRFKLENFFGLKLKQLPGAVLIYTAPTQSEPRFEAYGWMRDSLAVQVVEDVCDRLAAVHRLKKPPPRITLGRADRRPLEGAPAPIQPPSDHLRALGRTAYQNVLRRQLQERATGLWQQQLCNGGRPGEKGEHKSWLVQRSNAGEALCGCGGTCKEAREALRYPDTLALINWHEFSATNEENRILVHWAQLVDPTFKAWVEEREAARAKQIEDRAKLLERRVAADREEGDSGSDLESEEVEDEGAGAGPSNGTEARVPPVRGGGRRPHLFDPVRLREVFEKYNGSPRGFKAHAPMLLAEVGGNKTALKAALKAANLLWGVPTKNQVDRMKAEYLQHAQSKNVRQSLLSTLEAVPGMWTLKRLKAILKLQGVDIPDGRRRYKPAAVGADELLGEDSSEGEEASYSGSESYHDVYINSSSSDEDSDRGFRAGGLGAAGGEEHGAATVAAATAGQQTGDGQHRGAVAPRGRGGAGRGRGRQAAPAEPGGGAGAVNLIVPRARSAADAYGSSDEDSDRGFRAGGLGAAGGEEHGAATVAAATAGQQTGDGQHRGAVAPRGRGGAGRGRGRQAAPAEPGGGAGAVNLIVPHARSAADAYGSSDEDSDRGFRAGGLGAAGGEEHGAATVAAATAGQQTGDGQHRGAVAPRGRGGAGRGRGRQAAPAEPGGGAGAVNLIVPHARSAVVGLGLGARANRGSKLSEILEQLR